MDGAPDSLHQCTQRYGRYAGTRCWRQAAAAGEEERHVFFIGGQSGGAGALLGKAAARTGGTVFPSDISGSGPRCSGDSGLMKPRRHSRFSLGSEQQTGGLIPVLCCQQRQRETDGPQGEEGLTSAVPTQPLSELHNLASGDARSIYQAAGLVTDNNYGRRQAECEPGIDSGSGQQALGYSVQSLPSSIPPALNTGTGSCTPTAKCPPNADRGRGRVSHREEEACEPKTTASLKSVTCP
ncbi:hypothetical protein WMY93_026859 [Mugilogobius chulae]|uniref:Uncharacterized protein n=1 Tax=Mugilogobius chulae TaxID=88201 RepID=A0AAW0N9S0_9GOBI